MKMKKFVSILVVLVMLLVMCTGCSLTDKKESKEEEKEDEKPYMQVLDNYFNGMVKGNYNKYVKAFPAFSGIEEQIDEDDMEEMVEALEDEYGAKLKVSYEVKKEEEIKKDDLENIEKYISYKYDEKVKVSEGYKIKVTATIEGEDDEDTDSNDMYIYKIDGKWSYFSVSPEKAEDYVSDYEEEEK